ncbi:ATP-binding protein [Chroococcidiopsis sp [FACHB-1243]]|uniref:hybrid sensor histidine kinase/response regulator n=1 Tax=Chroococcidiopsis sp. [FACHB-1243] TaxID=2692781 RepID=UPI001F549B08|nr:ATP-binding protein [Chroococcidiopsis sp. [FACHB-1243]]
MKRSPLNRYGVALLTTVVALLLTQQLWWQLQPVIYPFFLSAVAISSWYGGIRPALLTIALSALASEYFFLPPIYTLVLSRYSLMRVGYFVLVALLIVTLNAMLRSARRQAVRDRELLQQNQERLYQSEERYRLMVERVRDYAIFMLDPKGYIINWNVGAERIFGYQEEEIVGQSWECLFTPEAIERSIPKQVLETAIIEGLSEENRRHSRKDGTQFWAHDVVTALWDRAGNLRGFSEVIQDITDRQRAEEEREQLLLYEQAARESAEAANRSKDEFLAIVSHELRTPMTAIVGWAGMLEAGKLDETKTALAVGTIARNANLQMQLIDDLLDISRIVRGDLSLNRGTVELASVITSALGVVQPAADTKGLCLNFSRALSDRLPFLVWGDPNRLQQIVWNLLVNAIKFTPEGGRVEVRLEKVKGQKSKGASLLGDSADLKQLAFKNVAEDQLPTTNYQLPITNFAQIQVTDTGIGIDRDFLPYVFDRFRQANSASTRAHKGLGLGLAIARHLVELHGGTIEAESLGTGHGATFRVLLPLMKTRGGDKGNTREKKIPLTPHLNGLRILVVDDEVDAQILVRTWLEECGAEITVVNSVDEAIEVLKRSKPDVLISDIGMPDKDGYVLIRHVKQIEAETRVKIGAIALTAYAREEDRSQALQAGFQLYLTKPVEPNQLIVAIASLAQRSEQF